MLERSEALAAAVTADARRTYVRAVVDISGPDKEFLPAQTSPEAPWSRPEQLHDRELSPPPRYATLEPGRCLLDGSFRLFPDGFQVPEHIGYAGEALSGADGAFETPPFITLRFAKIPVLQTVSLFFSTDPADGVPEDFTVEVLSVGTAYFTKEVRGNRESAAAFTGFTVWDPDGIRVTVSRWSLPGRRVRAVEILPGLYEEWSGGELAAFSVTQQGQFSCLSLPYGTAELAMDNRSRRFEPRSKDGIFQSIEARQDVDLYIGFALADGSVEYTRLGLFYQAGDGWRTGDNSLSMKWSLVDIIGLLSERTFLPPETLPVTLAGWLEALALQLGPVFALRWQADPDYGDVPVTADGPEAVEGKSCGDILRWACQASGTWPRADAATGKLTAEPLWNQGNKVTLDELSAYPVMKANESIAALLFQLSGGEELTVPGNQTASERTVTIKNPFLHTREDALRAARLILSCYGGNVIETTGRGDPAGEIGDVDAIWLDESRATAARRMSQTFQFQSGVLQGCRSRLLQADGSYLYEERVVLTKSGSWRAPAGVTRLRVSIGQGGQGGSRGQDGYIRLAGGGRVDAGPGEAGTDGLGGKVWWSTVDINPEQLFSVSIGRGGAASDVFGTPGLEGEETTFGPYTSAQGIYCPMGYTDIAAGDCFARTGVPSPLPGSGDGGGRGAGGTAGEGYAMRAGFTLLGSPKYELYVDVPPGPGQPGAPGANGFVAIAWDREEESSG